MAAAASIVSDGITGIITGAEDPVAEPESVVPIPVGRLVASRLLSASTVWLILLIVGIVIGSIVGTPWVLFAMIPALIGFGTYWVRTITRVAAVLDRADAQRRADHVRPVHHRHRDPASGARARGRGVPVDPVATVRMVVGAREPAVRPRGDRRAGRSVHQRHARQALRTDVERVLRLVLPALPETEWPAVFERTASSDRARTTRTRTPLGAARLLRLLSWRRNGFLVGPDALFLRRGFVWRDPRHPAARPPAERLGAAGAAVSLSARSPARACARIIRTGVRPQLGALDRDAALALFDHRRGATRSPPRA